jgi:hypothetical protein
MKISNVSEWHKWFKEVHENMEDKEVVIQVLSEPVKILKKCRIWCIQTVDQAYYVEIFKQVCEAVHRKSPELWPNSWILYQLPQLTQCSCPKISYWNGTPILFPDLAPDDICFQK